MVLRCYWWGVALFVAAVLSGASALSADSYPACRSLNPDGLHHLTLGDGLCNEIYNIEDCGFDGGDCCPCTCEGQAQGEQASGSECGSAGYNCLDPTASCFDKPTVDIRQLQTSDSYADTFSPTSSPTAAPTSSTFLDELGEGVSSAASGLSGAALGAIVGVCVVVAIIVAFYCIYKKSQSGAGGPEYAAAGSTNLA